MERETGIFPSKAIWTAQHGSGRHQSHPAARTRPLHRRSHCGEDAFLGQGAAAVHKSTNYEIRALLCGCITVCACACLCVCVCVATSICLGFAYWTTPGIDFFIIIII